VRYFCGGEFSPYIAKTRLKTRCNIKRYGVIHKVFYDPNAKIIYDPDHSEKEDRFIILGLSKVLNLLIVCHCYKEKKEKRRNKNIFRKEGD
jgi:uncharacterized DUF497 family protein